jgi:hypothetical protein
MAVPKLPVIANLEKPEPKKKKDHENTKKGPDRFRVFLISCFCDEDCFRKTQRKLDLPT